MYKVIAVVGPTASGKTNLAIDIALACNGEVISADSRQVFRGLDLGTGKVTIEEMRGVPHHLLDIADPTDRFSVEEYRTLARATLEDILSRGKVPIVCGGTGYYIDALLRDVEFPHVPPNTALRAELEPLPATELYEKLLELDPIRAESIDAHNPVRLVRAIEIATALGEVPVMRPVDTEADLYPTLRIGLYAPEPLQTERIKKRLHDRLEVGMLDEARRLHAEGLSYERMYGLGLEYRYMAMHLQGTISYEEMIETLATKIRQYAKRQMTWFKRDATITWFEVGQAADALKFACSEICK